jgi:hypothetical protein
MSIWDNASKTKIKKKAWMRKDWPLHLIFWSAYSNCRRQASNLVSQRIFYASSFARSSMLSSIMSGYKYETLRTKLTSNNDERRILSTH